MLEIILSADIAILPVLLRTVVLIALAWRRLHDGTGKQRREATHQLVRDLPGFAPLIKNDRHTVHPDAVAGLRQPSGPPGGFVRIDLRLANLEIIKRDFQSTEVLAADLLQGMKAHSRDPD